MKHLLLATIAALTLAGSVRADALEERAKHDSVIAKIIREEKAAGTYGPGVQADPQDIARADAYLTERYELNLRRMGMTPATARKGMWALAHKPNSACAGYIRQLAADADVPAESPCEAFAESDQMLIMSIEHSRTCERKNLG